MNYPLVTEYIESIRFSTENLDKWQSLEPVLDSSGSVVMISSGDGSYWGQVSGIAAKNLNDAVYVSFCYSDGYTSYCSGVNGYSIGQYCKSQAAKTGTMAELAKATAVYGYYAKQRFG